MSTYPYTGAPLRRSAFERLGEDKDTNWSCLTLTPHPSPQWTTFSSVMPLQKCQHSNNCITQNVKYMYWTIRPCEINFSTEYTFLVVSAQWQGVKKLADCSQCEVKWLFMEHCKEECPGSMCSTMWKWQQKYSNPCTGLDRLWGL
jgi:hypothetical protein